MKDKPLTLIIKDFTNEIVDVINNYKLPSYILLNELQKVINTIIIQDEEEIEKYNKEQEEKKCSK